MHALDAPVSALLRQVAAEVVMPHYRALAADEVSEKAPGEIVTVADRESEARLAAALPALLPGARVVGEEAVSADPSLLDGLAEGRVWLVDPIDGTSNYAQGSGAFAIMIALLDGGVTEAGWILDPVSGRMCHAAVGAGAFVDGAGVCSRATGAEPPRAALALRYLAEEQRERFATRAAGRLEEVAIPRCAGAQYPQLVLGETDVALFRRVLPWDHAAGALFLTEAGGRIAHHDGRSYDVADSGEGLIAAATPGLWERARAILLG